MGDRPLPPPEDVRHRDLIKRFKDGVETLPEAQIGWPPVYKTGEADTGLFQFGGISYVGPVRTLLVVRRPNIVDPDDSQSSLSHRLFITSNASPEEIHIITGLIEELIEK